MVAMTEADSVAEPVVPDGNEVSVPAAVRSVDDYGGYEAGSIPEGMLASQQGEWSMDEGDGGAPALGAPPPVMGSFDFGQGDGGSWMGANQ